MSVKNEMLKALESNLDYWAEHGTDGEKILTLGCDSLPLTSGRREAVLTARVLWAYSASYRLNSKPAWKKMADIAFNDIKNNFLDKEYGGSFESLDADGNVISDIKRTYTLAYMIYGLSQYCETFENEEALQIAKDIFALIEKNQYDVENDSFRSASDRTWKPVEGILEVDTYLHLCEAYGNLCKVWDDQKLKDSLSGIVKRLCGTWVWENGGMSQNLENDWTKTQDLSDRFADDAECMWMILTAADRIGSAKVQELAKETALRIADHIANEGYDNENGGVFDRAYPDGRMDSNKMWWEEAESVNAFVYAWKYSGNSFYLEKAKETWKFIKDHIICEDGRWNWMVTKEGEFIPSPDPSDPLMCPYHSARVSVLSAPEL